MEKQHEDWADGSLSVSSNRYGEDVIVVSLAGELDRSNVATAKAVLIAAAREGAALLVIDLDELQFLDASGIALLVEVSGLRGAEALRVVPSPAPEVKRMLDLTGIGSLIRLPSAVDEAAA
jgi:anti-sigma B factor antagonist